MTPVPPAISPDPPELSPAHRSHYRLEEVALYGLCPYRYKLERLSPPAKAHRETFQLRVLAQAEWLDALLRTLRDTPIEKEALRTALHRSAEHVEAPIRTRFSGLRRLD